MKIEEVIETLKEDYALRASLKRKNLTVQDELEDEIDDLEQSLIASKIIPELQQYAKTLLQDLECEIGLAVTKDANGNVEVKDDVFFAPSTPTQPIVVQPTAQTEPTPSPEPHEPTKQVINHTKGLKVTFRDGTVINESAAIETYKKALVKIGLDKVAATSLKHGDYGLVSKNKRPAEAGRLWQHKIGDWYVYVNISNQQKKDDLKKLSDMFGLGLVVEDGK